SGKLLVGRRPGRERVGELTGATRRFGLGEAARGVADPDDPMRRRGADARCETAHPAREDRAPRFVSQLLLEERAPVGEAMLLRERLAPAIVGDPRVPGRSR